MSRLTMLSMIFATTLALPATVVSAQDTEATAVRFAVDSDEVDATADAAIKKFAADFVTSGSKLDVNVAGHGEPGEVAQYEDSGKSYCYGLAQRRAMNVAGKLVEYGVSPSQTRTQTWGCDKPVAGADSAANRRVELTITESSW